MLNEGGTSPAVGTETAEVPDESELVGPGAPPQKERAATCPFPGPRAFKPEESEYLFGRKAEAVDLVSMVIANPITLLYSQSGAGKSSLIHTKLFDRLRERECDLLPVARVSGTKGVSGNPYTTNTLKSWHLTPEKEGPERFETLAEFARSLPAPVDCDNDPALRIAVFDQFEEIFTTHRTNTEHRKEFFLELNDFLAASPHLRVLLALREEYLAPLDTFASLVPGGLRARMRLERPSLEAATDALVQPFKKRGIRIERSAATRLLDRLRTVRDDSGREAFGDYVEPVQLQVVCRRIWFRLTEGAKSVTVDDVKSDLGDVRAALGAFYDEAVASTAATTRVSERKIRRWVERQLITESQTRGNAFRGPDSTEGIPNRVPEALDAALVVRREPRAGGAWYELAHDALIEPILSSNARVRARSRRNWTLAVAPTVLLGVAAGVGYAVASRAPAPEPVLADRVADFWYAPERRESVLAWLREQYDQRKAAAAGPTTPGADPARGPLVDLNTLLPTRPVKPLQGRPEFAFHLYYPPGSIDPGRFQREWDQRLARLAVRGYDGTRGLILDELPGNGKTLRLDLVRMLNDESIKDRPFDDGTKKPAGQEPAPSTPVPEKRGKTAPPPSARPPEPSGMSQEPRNARSGSQTVSRAPAAEPWQMTKTLPIEVDVDVRLSPAPNLGATTPRQFTDTAVLFGILPPELAAPAVGTKMLESLKDGDEPAMGWRRLQPWALPLFAQRTERLRPPEAVYVDELLRKIASEHPELFIDEPALPQLLHFAASRKDNADAAMSLSTGLRRFRCPTDFAEALAATARGFTHLPDVEALVDETLERGPRARLNGADCPDAWKALRGRVNELDQEAPPAQGIRVALGADIAYGAMRNDSSVRAELSERIDDKLAALFEQQGLPLLAPAFGVDRTLAATEFTLDTAEDLPLEPNGAAMLSTSTRAIGDLASAVLTRLGTAPARWVDLPMARRLSADLPEAAGAALRTWSAAEVVKLLHDVVAPPEVTPVGCPLSLDRGKGTTLGNARWLMPSLPFWRQISTKPSCVAVGLRMLEARRHERAGTGKNVSLALADGVRLLADGRTGEATSRFASELSGRKDLERAAEDFVAAYVAGYPVEDRVGPACATRAQPNSDPLGALRYEAMVEAKEALGSKDPKVLQRGRSLGVCLAQSLAFQGFDKLASQSVEAIDASVSGLPNALDPWDRATLAFVRLAALLPSTSNPGAYELPDPPRFSFDDLQAAAHKLAAAIGKLDDDDQANEFAGAALALCPSTGRTSRFCRSLPTTLVEGRPRALMVNWLAVDTLAAAAYDEKTEQVALAQIAKTEAFSGQAAARDQLWLKLAMPLNRIIASRWRWSTRKPAEQAKVEAEIGALLRTLRKEGAAVEGLVPLVSRLAISAASFSDDPDHVRNVIEQARRADPSNPPDLDSEEFKLAIWTGQRKDALRILERRVPDPSAPEAAKWGFQLAVAAALWSGDLKMGFLQNVGDSSEYPVHAQLLSAYGRAVPFDAARARQIVQDELASVWKRVDRSTWSDRLAEHDQRVWAELLLADFVVGGLEKTEQAGVEKTMSQLTGGREFDPAASQLADLGMTPDERRCEFHFYRGLRYLLEKQEGKAQDEFRQTIASGQGNYYEFAIATYIRDTRWPKNASP